MSSKLSSLLVQDGVVSIKRMEEAFQRQVIFGGNLDTILLEMTATDEISVLRYLHLSTDLPPADLTQIVFDPASEATRLFPQKLAEKYLIAPIALVGSHLRVLTTGPPDTGRLEELGFMLGVKLLPQVVPEFRLYQALELLYGVKMPLRYAGLAKRLGEPPPLDEHLDLAQASNAWSTVVDDTATPEAWSQAAPHPGDLDREEGSKRTVVGMPIVHVQPPPRPQRPAAPAATPAPPAASSPSEAADDDLFSEPENTLTGMPALEATPIPQPPAREPMVTPAPAPAPYAAPTPSAAPPTVGPPAAAAPPSRPRISPPLETPAPLGPPFDASPVSVEDAVALLAQASGRDEILQIFLRTAAAMCEYAAAFSVLGESAIGRTAIFRGEADAEHIARVQIPLTLPSIFRSAVESKEMYFGPVYDDGLNFGVLADMGRPVPAMAIAIPVLIRSRVVCLLYADNGLSEIAGEVPDKLVLVSYQISQAFQRLILQAKRENFANQPKPDPMNTGKLGLGQKRLMAVVKQAAGTPTDSGKHWAQPELSAPVTTRAPQLDGRLVDAPPRPRTGSGVQPAFPEHPPPAAPPARDIGGPSAGEPAFEPSPRGAPLVSDPTKTPASSVTSVGFYSLTESGIRDDLQPRRGRGSGHTPAPPSSPGREVMPGELQRGRVGQVAADAPPSQEDLVALVDDLERGGELGDLAAAALQRIGAPALRLVAARFPGRLTYNRLAHDGEPPPPSVHGPLINFVVTVGEPAVRYLIELLKADNPEIRYYATFVFTELLSPSALPHMLGPLFDPEPAVRRVATDVLKRHWGKPTLVPIMEHVRAELVGPHTFRRRCAAEVAGAMRDVEGIPRLIELVADRDAATSEAAQRALLVITKQAFGDSRRRWKAWWDKNQTRHRVEWLIDALAHKESECRFLAGQELHLLTGETLGYRFDQDKRVREEAVQRWQRWWASKGSARFSPK